MDCKKEDFSNEYINAKLWQVFIDHDDMPHVIIQKSDLVKVLLLNFQPFNRYHQQLHITCINYIQISRLKNTIQCLQIRFANSILKYRPHCMGHINIIKMIITTCLASYLSLVNTEMLSCLICSIYGRRNVHAMTEIGFTFEGNHYKYSFVLKQKNICKKILNIHFQKGLAKTVLLTLQCG